MLRNYLTVAIRNLLRNKTYSLINIVGLSVGMTVCLLALTYVADEVSYDRHHPGADRVYRVLHGQKLGDGEMRFATTSSAALKDALQSFPKVEEATYLWNWGPSTRMRIRNRVYDDKAFCLADPAIFDVLDLPFIEGNRSVLEARGAIVITASMARELFGRETPIGQRIRVENNHHSGDYEVRGILADFPPNTVVRFDFLTTSVLEGSGWLSGDWLTSWRHSPFETFVRLVPDANVASVEARMQSIFEQRMDPGVARDHQYRLQPLTSIHLSSAEEYGVASSMGVVYGDWRVVLSLGMIGVLILAVASLNYVNLATAQAFGRVKEMAMRKMVGASRRQLIVQLIAEAIGLASIAMLVAIELTRLSLPIVNTHVEKSMVLPSLIAEFLIVMVLLIGCLAGSYPALVLSGLRPLEAMKGRIGRGLLGSRVGVALTVLQFAISCALIVETGVIDRQLDFIRSKDLGFDQHQVVLLPIYMGDGASIPDLNNRLVARNQTVKQAFLSHPDVVAASAFRFGMSETGWSSGGGRPRMVRPEGSGDQPFQVRIQETDEGYVSTYGLTIVAGRDFSGDRTRDQLAYILNETAVRAFGWTNTSAMGKSLNWSGSRNNEVIGVVRDYHHQSLKAPVQPLALTIRPRLARYLALRVNVDRFDKLVPFLEQTWNRFAPEKPFVYRFEDDNFALLYAAEEQFGGLVKACSALGILIACIGLFGLSSYAITTRTKEIGVRKAVGGSVRDIVWMLYRDFMRPVTLGIGVALPVAYFAMQYWLEGFAYRTAVSVDVLGTGAVAVIVIALSTVTYHTVKAASEDVVVALRDE